MAKVRLNRLYHIYWSMRKRCENKNHSTYKNYGARGITCQWRTYKEFYNDMVGSYKEGLTIDRIDNNGNYCIENCRWATYKDQENNRRDNRRISINGKIKNFSQWVEFYKTKRNVVAQRYYVYKWDILKSLTFPIKERRYFG